MTGQEDPVLGGGRGGAGDGTGARVHSLYGDVLHGAVRWTSSYGGDGARARVQSPALTSTPPCRGIDVVALDMTKKWTLRPSKDFTVGSIISGGDIYAMVQENELIDHALMLFPGKSGRITWLAPAGDYTLKDDVIEITDASNQKERFTMVQYWPVRSPRPCAEKLAGDYPLLTGQRVLDALFPSVLGGTCAVPGAFGCGKTVISQVRAAPARPAHPAVVLGVSVAEHGCVRWGGVRGRRGTGEIRLALP